VVYHSSLTRTEIRKLDMVKTGKMVVGKTPSEVSGKPSDHIEDDEPLCDDEQPVDPGFKKLAHLMLVDEKEEHV
jgi:hypothetical protein